MSLGTFYFKGAGPQGAHTAYDSGSEASGSSSILYRLKQVECSAKVKVTGQGLVCVKRLLSSSSGID